MLVSTGNINSVGENTFSTQAAEFKLMQSDFLLNKVIGTLAISFHTTEVLFRD